MRSSWSESRRLRSVSSVCSRLRPEICHEMYHEYATTVASVMIKPSNRAVVGERPGVREAVNLGGLYQPLHGQAMFADAGGIASTGSRRAERESGTTPTCRAVDASRTSRPHSSR